MFKRSLILPALAVLALAACDDKDADQTSAADPALVTTTEIAPSTGTGEATATVTTTAPDGTTVTTTATSPTSGVEAAPADTTGNAGPATGTTAETTPAAPNPETFNEEAATDTVQDDTTCGDHSAWVGQPVDEAALTETGKVYRVMKAGDPMTMDHNADRINVEQDDAGMVTRVWCG